MATVSREFLQDVWLGCRILVPAIVVLLLLPACNDRNARHPDNQLNIGAIIPYSRS